MAGIQSHRDLIVWQKSMDMVLCKYINYQHIFPVQKSIDSQHKLPGRQHQFQQILRKVMREVQVKIMPIFWQLLKDRSGQQIKKF